MASRQRNTNEIVTAKKHGENISFSKDDTHDRGQGEKEASGTGTEISKFSETSRA